MIVEGIRQLFNDKESNHEQTNIDIEVRNNGEISNSEASNEEVLTIDKNDDKLSNYEENEKDDNSFSDTLNLSGISMTILLISLCLSLIVFCL